MAIKPRTAEQSTMPQLSSEPLTLSQLNMFADEILAFFQQSRPEFLALAQLQRNSGCRINELFQRERWTILTDSILKVEPQKGNASRIIPVSDLGFVSVSAMASLFLDMTRLPKTQYERCFSRAVDSVGLWRHYEFGFTGPSSHFFRHLKVKNMAAQNFSVEQIGTYIGEKNLDNLNYYFNSQFYSEIR